MLDPNTWGLKRPQAYQRRDYSSPRISFEKEAPSFKRGEHLAFLIGAALLVLALLLPWS